MLRPVFAEYLLTKDRDDIHFVYEVLDELRLAMACTSWGNPLRVIDEFREGIEETLARHDEHDEAVARFHKARLAAQVPR